MDNVDVPSHDAHLKALDYLIAAVIRKKKPSCVTVVTQTKQCLNSTWQHLPMAQSPAKISPASGAVTVEGEAAKGNSRGKQREWRPIITPAKDKVEEYRSRKKGDLFARETAFNKRTPSENDATEKNLTSFMSASPALDSRCCMEQQTSRRH
jgi:hypothetical protein